MEIQENTVSCGFKITAVRPVKDTGGTFVEMVHQKTGTQLIWHKRNDVNKTFAIGFRTIPQDDTGVFHILEHSVLNGSDRYPVREPFVDLLKGSLQTFLNAFTFPDKTVYPVCSRNDKDFLNLVSVYMDAVFHPGIYHNRNVFYQEGWHYELKDPDAMPVYKGVVLNEMKGSFASVDEALYNEMNRKMFPDNCYRFVSGGDPKKITTLSYEDFLQAHKRFYHPSNARIWLDGDMKIEEVLSLINDEYLSFYEAEKPVDPIAMQKPVQGYSRIEYEISEEEDVKRNSYLSLGRILCGFEDAETLYAASILNSVLAGSNDAPFRKAVLESELAGDLDLDTGDTVLQPSVVLTARNCDPEDFDKIVDVLFKTAKELAEKGLDHDELDAVLNRLEFRLRDPGEPAGLMYGFNAMKSWMYDGDPAVYLELNGILQSLREKIRSGWFEQFLLKIWSDPSDFVRVEALPSRTEGQKRRLEEQERLKKAKESWSEAEISELIRQNEELEVWQNTPDTPEQKATLPQLKLEEVSAMPEPYEAKIVYEQGNEVRLFPVNASGISYVNLYYPVDGLKPEELSRLSFMTDLLGSLPTKKHSLSELQTRIKADTGVLEFRCTAVRDLKDPSRTRIMLVVNAGFLTSRAKEAMELIREIMEETVFEKEKIRDLAAQAHQANRRYFIEAGNSMAAVRNSAKLSANGVAREYMGGLEDYKAIKELTTDFDHQAEQWIEWMQEKQKEIFTRDGLVISVSAEEVPEFVSEHLKKTAAGTKKEIWSHYEPLKAQPEWIVIPADVGFSNCMNDLSRYGYEYDSSLAVLSNILTYDYLWNLIRVQGSAYGTSFSGSLDGTVSAGSYRDPDPLRSAEVYKHTAAYVKAFAQSDEDLTRYIIGTIASAEPLLSNGAKITAGDERLFYGISYQDRCARRRQTLSVDKEQLNSWVSGLEKALKEGVLCIAGPKSEAQSDIPFVYYTL